MRKMSGCSSTLKGSRAKKTFIKHTQWLKQNGILSIFDKKLKLASAIFCQIFIFRQIIALQKLWKMFFISSKKVFSFLIYWIFCNFFPPFPHFPDSKGQMGVDKFMMSWIGLHIFADAIFTVLQKPLYITSSNLVR